MGEYEPLPILACRFGDAEDPADELGISFAAQSILTEQRPERQQQRG